MSIFARHHSLLLVSLLFLACGGVDSPPSVGASPAEVCAVSSDKQMQVISGYPVFALHKNSPSGKIVRDQNVQGLRFTATSFLGRPACKTVNLKGLQFKFEYPSDIIFSLQQEGRIIKDDGLARRINEGAAAIGEITFDLPLTQEEILFVKVNTGFFKRADEELLVSLVGSTWQVAGTNEYWSRKEDLSGNKLVYEVKPLSFNCKNGFNGECAWTNWRNSSGYDLRSCTAPPMLDARLQCDFSRCLSSYETLEWGGLPAGFSAYYYTSLENCRAHYVVFNK